MLNHRAYPSTLHRLLPGIKFCGDVDSLRGGGAGECYGLSRPPGHVDRLSGPHLRQVFLHFRRLLVYHLQRAISSRLHGCSPLQAQQRTSEKGGECPPYATTN